MNTDLLTLSNEALGAALRAMLTGLLDAPKRPTAEMAVQCYGPDFLASLSDDGSDTAAPLLGRESTPPRQAMRPPPMPGAKAASKKRAKAGITIVAAKENPTAQAVAKSLAKNVKAAVGAKVRVRVAVRSEKKRTAKMDSVEREAERRRDALLKCVKRAGCDGASADEIAKAIGVPRECAVAAGDALACYGAVSSAGRADWIAYGVDIQAARAAAKRASAGRKVAA